MLWYRRAVLSRTYFIFPVASIGVPVSPILPLRLSPQPGSTIYVDISLTWSTTLVFIVRFTLAPTLYPSLSPLCIHF